MAGCRPEYMPVLVAAVEAMCDPRFRIEDAGSTPGWEPLVIVSGPIIKELDLHSGQGVMRVGRQANTSIGRFVRLYLRNVCGYRIPPGAGDKGSIGNELQRRARRERKLHARDRLAHLRAGPRISGRRECRDGDERRDDITPDLQRGRPR